MMRPILVLSGWLLLCCAALIGGMRTLAQRDPPPHVQALLPDSACPAPCWQGLRPGYSPIEAVEAWLAEPPPGWRVIPLEHGAPGVQTGEVLLPGDDMPSVRVIHVLGPRAPVLQLLTSRLTLGAVIAALDTPDAISFNLVYMASRLENLEFHLYYLDQHLVVTGMIRVDRAYLLPETPVRLLTYHALPMARPLTAFDWRGFGTLRRYYPDGVMP